MTEKKKVLLVNDFEKGGGAEGVFQMTAELLSDSYEVFQYTAYKGFEDSGSNPLSYIFSKKHYLNIRNLIVEKGIDIVHIHNFRWISPSVLYVKKWLKKHHSTNVKFIMTAHDYLLACPNVAYGYYDKNKKFIRYPIEGKPGSFLFKQMDQHGFKFSILKKMQWYLAFKILNLQKQMDLVITPSIFLQKILHLNYPSLPIQVVRNPLPASILNEADLLQNRKQESQTHKIRLIYFGRVASEKGTDLLLEMLSKIKENTDFSLDIYGTGPLSEEINPMINSLKLNDCVHYHGFKAFDEIQKSFGDYDAFIMSSIWYENAPLSIVEAAINGLSIITPNMGGMKELATLCGNSFFYELEDHDSLKNSLLASKQNKNLFLDLSNIYSIFSEKVYLETIKNKYENPSYR